MRTKARKDANAKEIVDHLRAIGVKVFILNDPDIGDLLTGYRGVLRILEIKDGAKPPSRRKLRPGQKNFHEEWRDFPIFKVENCDEALKAHQITR